MSLILLPNFPWDELIAGALRSVQNLCTYDTGPEFGFNIRGGL